MKKLGYFIFFSLFLFTFLACGPGKNVIGESKKELKEQSSDFLIQELTKQYIDYDWFVGKAKMYGEREGFGLSFTANVRIKRDSIIWISISKIGLEAYRILIRPDSVFAISRFEKIYIAEKLDHFAAQYDINADYATLQGLFTGEAPYLTDREFKSEIQGKQYYIHSTQEDPKLQYWLHGSRYFVEKIEASDRLAGNVWAEFSDYREFDDKPFSYFRDMKFETAYGEKNSLSIRWNSIEFNVPGRVPFRIPSRYERMEL